MKTILFMSIILLSSCAVKTPGGYTYIVAPQAIHELYANEPMDMHTPNDKRRLAAILRRTH